MPESPAELLRRVDFFFAVALRVLVFRVLAFLGLALRAAGFRAVRALLREVLLAFFLLRAPPLRGLDRAFVVFFFRAGMGSSRDGLAAGVAE
jgi:hypothetical protein